MLVLSITVVHGDYVVQSHVEPVYDSGAYQFSYATGGAENTDAQHFREETRDDFGNVIGKYGYVDPYGQLRFVLFSLVSRR